MTSSLHSWPQRSANWVFSVRETAANLLFCGLHSTHPGNACVHTHTHTLVWVIGQRVKRQFYSTSLSLCQEICVFRANLLFVSVWVCVRLSERVCSCILLFIYLSASVITNCQVLSNTHTHTRLSVLFHFCLGQEICVFWANLICYIRIFVCVFLFFILFYRKCVSYYDHLKPDGEPRVHGAHVQAERRWGRRVPVHREPDAGHAPAGERGFAAFERPSRELHRAGPTIGEWQVIHADPAGGEGGEQSQGDRERAPPVRDRALGRAQESWCHRERARETSDRVHAVTRGPSHTHCQVLRNTILDSKNLYFWYQLRSY